MTPTTPDDFAAAAERMTEPWASYHSPEAAAQDCKLLAREYLRLAPFIAAVRDRRAEWEAAEPGANGCAGFAYAETLDRFADAVCRDTISPEPAR